MATTNIKWGTMSTTASAGPYTTGGSGSEYAGVSPVIFESGSTANHGFGVRMHARTYYNTPASMFQSSSSNDVQAHNRGVRQLASVSHMDKAVSGFTWDKATNGVSAGVGSYDSTWTAMFTRMTSNLNFSAAVATTAGTLPASGGTLLGSYGGLTEPEVELALDHEIGRPVYNTLGNGTNYKAYVRHIHNLMVTAGVRNKFKINFCASEYTIRTAASTLNGYYPGDDVIDVIGIDYYGDFTSTWVYDGSTSSFASGMATAFAWLRANHPTKPHNFPEFQEAESSNDTDMQNWFTGIGTFYNASANQDLTCTGIYLWTQASSKYQSYAKISTDSAVGVAHLGKHNGIAAAIAATGGNAPIGTVAGTVPSAPTGLSISLGSDGTTATLSWSAAPAWTPSITGERLYIGDGVTTNLHRQDAPAGSPDHALGTSYQFTGLVPGNTYTVSVTFANSVGNSGFATTSSGALLSFTTTTPGGTSNAPSITTPVTIVQNNADALEYDFSVGATDPNSLPLAYAWTFTSPTGVKVTATGASGTTPELNEPGVWSFAATATNTLPLSVTQTGTFNVVVVSNTQNTKYLNWAKPQTGDRVASLGPLLRGFLDDLDNKMRARIYRKSNSVLTGGLVAEAFPIAAMHSSNTQALTSGWGYWTAVEMMDDHFDEIWFLTKTTAQSGTGTQLAVYDQTGTILPNGVYSGTNVDAAFQAAVGPNVYKLSTDSITPEQNLTPGAIYYIVVKNSGAGTAPLLVVSGTPGTAAKLGDFAQTQPVFGGWNNGAGTLPNNIPFGSWTNQQRIWLGLGASDVSPQQ